MDKGAGKLTKAQRRALAYLATVEWATPGDVGSGMDDGTYRRGLGLTAQGAGRLGGVMCTRLARIGLVANASLKRNGWAAWAITPAGREALNNGK